VFHFIEQYDFISNEVAFTEPTSRPDDTNGTHKPTGKPELVSVSMRMKQVVAGMKMTCVGPRKKQPIFDNHLGIKTTPNSIKKYRFSGKISFQNLKCFFYTFFITFT
jgi:hypothetical protein